VSIAEKRVGLLCRGIVVVEWNAIYTSSYVGRIKELYTVTAGGADHSGCWNLESYLPTSFLVILTTVYWLRDQFVAE
jgi:hypothetical protein